MDAIVKYKESRDSLFRYSGIAPESKYVATKGPVRNTHYLEMGKGEPFILIHGGLSHSCEWFPLLKPLSDHFHLYVIDRPGHGLTDTIDYNGMDFRQSAVEFLHSFMQSIGLERAHIMGNSIGGFFAISFALMHPEKVENLVLIGAPAGLNRWIHPMLRLMGTKGINRLLAQTIAKPGISGFKMLHKKLLVVDTNRLPAVYFENGYHQILLPGVADSQRIMLENVLSLKGWKKKLLLTDELSSLTVPVHFIWGMKDAFESPETGIEKARVIQNFTFEKIADAGHIPWFDQPEKCASHIIKLLKNNKMILLKNMIAFFFFAFMCLNAYSQSDAGAQQRLPVIDMHMHAFDIPVDLPAREPAPCLPAPCVRQGHASASSSENFEKTLEMMDRYNIVKGFLSDLDPDIVKEWVTKAPGRFVPGTFIINPEESNPESLRTMLESGEIAGIGEIGAQLIGIAPNDPSLDPYYALAEDFDVPVLIHTEGIGPPIPSFRSAAGHPLLLEDVLVKHRNLRIYLENSGFPYLDEMITLMYQYPQVYGDLSTITWIIPRSAFYDYLKRLMEAGLGKRLMFGSDQMRWPEMIGKGIEAIEAAGFLTEEQKRDILYNNAVRFLRPTDKSENPSHSFKDND